MPPSQIALGMGGTGPRYRQRVQETGPAANPEQGLSGLPFFPRTSAHSPAETYTRAMNQAIPHDPSDPEGVRNPSRSMEPPLDFMRVMYRFSCNSRIGIPAATGNTGKMTKRGASDADARSLETSSMTPRMFFVMGRVRDAIPENRKLVFTVFSMM